MTPYQNMPPAGSPPGYQPPSGTAPAAKPRLRPGKEVSASVCQLFWRCGDFVFCHQHFRQSVSGIFDSTVLSVYRAAVVWQFGGCVLFIEYRRLCPVFFRRLWGIPAFFEDAVAGCGPIKTGAGRNRIVEHSRNICSFGDRINFDLPFFSAVFCNRLSTGDQ